MVTQFLRVFWDRLLQESTSAWVVDDWYLTTGDGWCHTLSDNLSKPDPIHLLSPISAPHGLHVSNSHPDVLHLQVDLIVGARVQLYRNPGFEYHRKWVEAHALHFSFSPCACIKIDQKLESDMPRPRNDDVLCERSHIRNCNILLNNMDSVISKQVKM